MKYITRTISGWNITATYKPHMSEEKTETFYENGTEKNAVKRVKNYLVRKLNVDSFTIDNVEHIDVKYRATVDAFISIAEKI